MNRLAGELDSKNILRLARGLGWICFDPTLAPAALRAVEEAMGDQSSSDWKEPVILPPPPAAAKEREALREDALESSDENSDQ
jgi:hypothetical protein